MSRVISLMGDLLSWKLLQVNHLIQNHLTQKANCLWKLHYKENQRGIITQILYYPGHLLFLLQQNSVFNRLMCFRLEQSAKDMSNLSQLETALSSPLSNGNSVELENFLATSSLKVGFL